MNKSEFISKALSRVKSKAAKEEISRELEAHIADRIEYYTDAGYSLEYATEKALERMGEAEDIGDKMNNIHDDTPLLILEILLQLAFVAAVLSGLVISHMLYYQGLPIADYCKIKSIHSVIIVLLFCINYKLCISLGMFRPVKALGIEAVVASVFECFVSIALSIFADKASLPELESYNNIVDFFIIVFNNTDSILVIMGIVAITCSVNLKNKLDGKINQIIVQRYSNCRLLFYFVTALLFFMSAYINVSI